MGHAYGLTSFTFLGWQAEQNTDEGVLHWSPTIFSPAVKGLGSRLWQVRATRSFHQGERWLFSLASNSTLWHVYHSICFWAILKLFLVRARKTRCLRWCSSDLTYDKYRHAWTYPPQKWRTWSTQEQGELASVLSSCTVLTVPVKSSVACRSKRGTRSCKWALQMNYVGDSITLCPALSEYMNIRGRSECTQKRNKSLLLVGLEPWTFQSAVQCFNQ